MAVLQELAVSAAPKKPVLLLWSFRQRQELELLCPPLLALAGALRLSLTTRLFYTGPALNSVPKTVAEPQQHLLLLKNKAAADGFAANSDIIQAKDQNDDCVIHVNADPSTYESFKTCSSSCSSSSFSSSCSSSGCSSSSSFSSSRANSECGSGCMEAAASQPCMQASPLAPVASLGSFSSQAWLKLLLLAAGYAGEARQLLPPHNQPAKNISV
ncbi:hypothetical protein OEZ86_008089 [Tetradesmus obliquus]|nr:hypothetical protein OEZ86_008089 [Tetradesmus obliquus]